MIDTTIIAKLRDLTIKEKRGFAERLFLVIRKKGDPAEIATRRVVETLKSLGYLDTTKLCGTGT